MLWILLFKKRKDDYISEYEIKSRKHQTYNLIALYVIFDIANAYCSYEIAGCVTGFGTENEISESSSNSSIVHFQTTTHHSTDI